MFSVRPEIRVHSFELQRLVQEFTAAPRFWTGYPIDKIEHMMRFYQALPQGFYYAKFDADTEEAVFQAQPDMNDIPWTTQRMEQLRGECPRLPAGAKLLLTGPK